MNTPTNQKRKANKTTKALQHFTLIANENNEKSKFYKCIHCERKINGTKSSNLAAHLQIHPEEYAKIIERSEHSIEFIRQKLLFNCVELITINGRPFSALYDSAILAMLSEKLAELEAAGRSLNLRDPHLKEVKDHLRITGEKVFKKIHNEVKNKPLSLLVDIVSKRGRSLLGTSVQYIHNRAVKVHCISMMELHESHTGIYLADKITKRLADFGINLKQIITITTDNGANVLKMVRDMGENLQKTISAEKKLQTPVKPTQNATESVDNEIEEILALPEDFTISDDEQNTENMTSENEDQQALRRILYGIADEPSPAQIAENNATLSDISSDLANSYGLNVIWDIAGINCSAHTLQLSVEDALKLLSKANRNVIDLCRLICKLLRSKKVKAELIKNGHYCKHPRIDVATRWGSLYIMLLDIHECHESIQYLAGKKKECQLLLNKWDILQEFIAILKIPYKGTIALQKKDLSMSDAYAIWLRMKMHLEELSQKFRTPKTSLLKKLTEAINIRKNTILYNPVMLGTLFLDVRFRSIVTTNNEFNEQAQRTLLNLWHRIQSLEATDDTAEATNHINSSRVEPSESSILNFSFDFENNNMLDDYIQRNEKDTMQVVAQSMSTSIDFELESFQADKLPADSCMISFWESNKDKYPCLYKLAMAMFAIPPTEVAVERDFSKLQLIFTDRRCKLAEDLLEIILIIHLNKELFYEVVEDELLKIQTNSDEN